MNNYQKNVLLFILVFFLLKPTGLEFYYPTLNIIMNFFKLITMILVLILYIRKRKKINANIVILLSIEALSIVSCIINHQSPYNAIVFWQGILSLILFYEIFEDESQEFVKTIIRVLALYIIANFIHALINYHNIEITKTFLLGKKNMIILYVFPYLSLITLNRESNKKRVIMEFFISIIAILSIIISNSSTSVVICLIMFIYYLFYRLRLLNFIMSKIKAKHIYFIILSFFIVIIVFGVQKYFSYFLIDVLDRDLTFTGRTYIWEKAIYLITKKPIFGYGWDSIITNVKSIMKWLPYTDASHAHNLILSLAHKSGIIVSFLYCLFTFRIADSIDELENSNYKNSAKIVYLLILVMLTFEAYTVNVIALFFIYYYISNNKKKIENKTSKKEG